MIKEMRYGRFKKAEILAEGTYKNHFYWVISYGDHPCCYIEVRKRDSLYGANGGLNVHWGITYANSHLPFDENIKGWFLGWDYGHYGDFTGTDLMVGAMESSALKECFTEEYDLKPEVSEEDFRNAIKKYTEEYGDGLLRGKIWTTKELIEECKNGIDNLLEHNVYC